MFFAILMRAIEVKIDSSGNPSMTYLSSFNAMSTLSHSAMHLHRLFFNLSFQIFIIQKYSPYILHISPLRAKREDEKKYG